MDLIHKLTIAALLALTATAAVMLIQHNLAVQGMSNGTAENQKINLQKAYEKRIARDNELYAEVVQLLERKQFAPAMEKLKAIKTAHPENPQSFVYQAQLEYGQGQIAQAIHSYRAAVDKDPDYIDKKTPMFIGETIMKMINEGRSKLNREKKLKPGDTSIKLALEDVYYLQRRLAGGCE